jgi:hypothetical protein
MTQPNPFATATSTPAQPDPFAQAADGSDPFAGPAPKAAKAPRIMDLGVGRLVMIRPCAATTTEQPAHPSVLKTNPGATVPRMTADVIVLDGPYMYGGKPENGQPHTITGQAGELFRAVWITQKGLISQCMTNADGSPRFGSSTPFALGRLYKGQATDGNPPWLLSPPTPEDVAVARAWVAANPTDPFGAARTA